MIVSVLIAIIVAALVLVILMGIKGSPKGKKEKGVSDKIQKKGKSSIIREAEKKLSHDPKHVPSLELLGKIYYEEKNWDKVYGIYKTLFELSTTQIGINRAFVTLYYGIACFELDKIDESLNVLMSAMKQEPESFDANFYLGKALYKKGGFDKAIVCFRKAKLIKPENVEVMEFIALCFYQMKKYKEALPFLKRVLDDKPDDKQLLFFAAISMTECGMGDKALKIFMHLRPNAQFGAQSCLEAGKMHERVKDFQTAIQDYSIALKLENVNEQTELQIRYRLANTYLAINDISKALDHLRFIQSKKSGYKDVDALVMRYQELRQNKNLQTYLMAGTSDFVALCRKLISIYHSEGFVKIEDVSVASETVEIICHVESPKWTAKEIFRFYRNQNSMGDIYVREFHTKLRDTKCDLGLCVTMGSFSDSAHKYIEGRPIDLIEKDQLTKLLKKINLLG